jgi:ATP-dependent Lhr-like helicase
MDVFPRLAPFIQEYIYKQQWEKFRDIQIQAIEGILDTPNHILICSGTASGKTEACMLPILTKLIEDPPESIGVIYIGPLKALINDQFERIRELIEETDIPIQSWHGDISRLKKEKFIKKAKGILQITPESLESMLINRFNDLYRLFHDLRFIVIDEIHAFMGSDRGLQILAQIFRLTHLQEKEVRRVGLSATIGDTSFASNWLRTGSNTVVTLVQETTTQREIMLGIEYFRKEPLPDTEEPVRDEDYYYKNPFYQHLFESTVEENKTLIFTNSRAQTEDIIVGLRDIAKKNRYPDFYHIHHGSIAKEIRTQSEKMMKDPSQRTCIGATVTLELGIDIGQLDQVLQVQTPNSVSSFLQRLGRSGRRDNPAKMFFYIDDEDNRDKYEVVHKVPWKLIQSIAIIQLYLEEKWIEPAEKINYPYSLLYHQTMSIMATYNELLPGQLAEKVLPLPIFKHITEDDYKIVLQNLIETNHLEKLDEGSLILGLEGEKIVNNYHFYATFEDEKTYQVKEKTRNLGTIEEIPAVGTTILISGEAWRVVEILFKQKTVLVEKSLGKANAYWAGTGPGIHAKIVEKMREVLLTDDIYPYLNNIASEKLEKTRQLVAITELLERNIHPLGGYRYVLLPWKGTETGSLLSLILNSIEIDIKEAYLPYYIIIETINIANLVEFLNEMTSQSVIEEIGNLDKEELEKKKYDKFIPKELLEKSTIHDVLKVNDNISTINNLFSNN